MTLANTHSDVLIVGGGIIGLACAHYLIKEGRQVRIIEKDKVFTGASHGNCGLIFSSHLLPLCSPGIVLNEIKRLLKKDSPIYLDLKPDLKRFMWLLKFVQNSNPTQLIHTLAAREALLRNSRLLYESLFSEGSLPCDRQTDGILMVFKDQEAMESYGSSQWFAETYGLQLQPYIGSQLTNLEPTLKSDLYGGWLYKNDTHLRPDMLGTSWKNELEQKGVLFEENCLTMGFECQKDRIQRVITSHGSFTASEYVLAAGAWVSQFEKQLKLKLPIQPAKGYSISMERPETSPNLPCYFYEKRVVATPWKSGLRLGGIMELTGHNLRIVRNRLQQMKKDAELYIKTDFSGPDQAEWAGLRPLTSDDLPIIDRSPRQKNLYIAGGHGTTGMSMAPSTGKLITELITGNPTHIDTEPYSIQRFQ